MLTACIRINLRPILISMMTLFALGGCDKRATKASSTPTSSSAAVNEPTSIEEESDRLYRIYLRSDADKARQSILQIIEISKRPEVGVRVRAHNLWLAYARLYLLSNETGVKQEESNELSLAVYWYRRELDCEPLTPQEVHRRVESMTGERIAEIAQEWDKRFTSNRGPNYRLKKPLENASRPSSARE